MQNEARKTIRLSLFSENERNYLKGKKTMGRVIKSQFHHNLDKRFEALLKDLELIHKTPHLKAWKRLHADNYHMYFQTVNYFSNLFSSVEKGYVSALRRISSGKNKKYWLDHAPLKDKRIDERVFDPNFLFRHVRSGLNDNDKRLFLKAFDVPGILPTKKEEAITLKEIKKRLSGESKTRSDTILINSITKDTFSDSRNYKIWSIIEKHKKRNYKALNKKLSQYDSKIIQYVVSPYLHPEIG